MNGQTTLNQPLSAPVKWVVGAFITMVSVIVVGTASVTFMFHSIDTVLTRLDEDHYGKKDAEAAEEKQKQAFSAVKKSLDDLSEEQYTLSAAEAAALRQAADNPGMVVPNPRDPINQSFHYPPRKVSQ